MTTFLYLAKCGKGRGCLAFSVLQILEVREKLEQGATLVGCPLVLKTTHPLVFPNTIKPELLMESLRNNSALAIELADAYLMSYLNSRLSDQDTIGAVRLHAGSFLIFGDPAAQVQHPTVYKLKFVLNRNILTSHKHPVNGSVVFGKQRASDCSYDGDLGSYVSIAGHTDLVSSALPT
ncbi:hypothetical protein MCOR29_005950 [Pyricularia oryzae]|nr:hypothetical protein MCOR19_007848 [Pyricularia oryzae]KAI6264644.1 hypothetical protein MCOR26_011220 [Pyricularia oryzae]KAI6318516.1 hypothetical protein MCOR29_005950 [Pyricularia oryzae]KAI6367448.1 hypothetical protein MCOR31_006020 [Pyricularia oryzae]KAI6387160.1 hypothetical protein MCOR24_011082 [Pyricularia oryzae]